MFNRITSIRQISTYFENNRSKHDELIVNGREVHEIIN